MVLGLGRCPRAALQMQSRWLAAPLAVERALWAARLYLGPAAAVHGLSCPVACGIFPDQGSHQCPLYCKALDQWEATGP